MILSVSRRTDIPARYADWFFHRLQQGDVLVRNPMRPHSVARIPLTPDIVDGIVFWTKNPAPLLSRLPLLRAYPFYVQVTLNAYGPDLEPGVPSKQHVVLPAMRRLADAIGPERVIWRYDPILLNPTYTIAHHLTYFERIAGKLRDVTHKCIFGFIDEYRNTRHNAGALSLRPVAADAIGSLVPRMAQVAASCEIALEACCESPDLAAFGVMPSCCIDAGLLERIAGRPLRLAKDRSQRKECRCAESIDIGAYNTCPNGCKYCYANYDEAKIPRNAALHDPQGPLLFGSITEEDEVYNRKVVSCKKDQEPLRF